MYDERNPDDNKYYDVIPEKKGTRRLVWGSD